MNYKWYRCKARDMNIFKPDGIVLKFWIGGTDEDSVRKVLIEKGCIEIEYIKEDDKGPTG